MNDRDPLFVRETFGPIALSEATIGPPLPRHSVPPADDDYLFLSMCLRRAIWVYQANYGPHRVCESDRAMLEAQARDELARLEERGLVDSETWTCRVDMDEGNRSINLSVLPVSHEGHVLLAQARRKWGLDERDNVEPR